MRWPIIGAADFSDLTSHAYFQKFKKHLINVLVSCAQRLRFPLGNSEIHPTLDNTRNNLGHGINNCNQLESFPHIPGKQEYY